MTRGSGRGLYPTFNAKYPLLRWPLDHLFVSPHFELMQIDRLPDIGSDHFPIYFRLCLKENRIGAESGAIGVAGGRGRGAG